MSLTQAKGFLCKECVEATNEIEKPDVQLSFCDYMELVKSFCNLRDRLIASGDGNNKNWMD